MAEPLLEWTRPLKPHERRADVESDLPDVEEAIRVAFRAGAWRRDPSVRADMLPRNWAPVLPRRVPQCAVCTLPNQHGFCNGCKKVEHRLGHPVDSLEFLTVAGIRDIRSPEAAIWDWKEQVAREGSGPEEWLLEIAAALSAYVEAHRERMLGGAPLVTAIPSRAPVISGCFWLAEQRGWFRLDLEGPGDKRGEWFQHLSNQDERLSRTEESWALRPADVAGRDVLLFDDVFVTGASMYSYAKALKAAGAGEVRAVAVIRHVRGVRHADYCDAVRIVRRTQELQWSPGRPGLARLG